MESVLFWMIPLSSLFALFFAGYFYRSMKKSEKGNRRMEEIAGYVRIGAYAYLFRQYKIVFAVFVFISLLLLFLAYLGIQNPLVPIAFLSGGFLSALCGFIGMKTATYASSRTAQGARTSLDRALKVAFRSGAVMGLVVVGFGLLYIFSWYLILDRVVFTSEHIAHGVDLFGMSLVAKGLSEESKLNAITTTMLTFGMGASTQALFARVGGGIFTKGADIAADLAGKVEAGIPEDDPRNPAVIADNVGDNVGDVAGMGADLYESYCGSILAASALGAALPAVQGFGGLKAVIAPMIVAAAGILFSILGILIVRARRDASMKSLLFSINTGIWVSSLLLMLSVAALAFSGFITWGVFGAVCVGIATGLIIGRSTEYYTSDDYSPTQEVAQQAETGPAAVIINGFSLGMFSAAIPVVTIAFGVIGSFYSAGGVKHLSHGLYGIAFAAVGMLATLGITLATDAYGPIADNAGGNAEMSKLPSQVRERTDALDMLGNTTAATGKGFAIGSAALTAMALLAAYLEEVKIWVHTIAGKSSEGFYQISNFRFFQTMPSVEGINELASKGIVALSAEKIDILDLARAYDLSILNPVFLAGLFLGGMVVLLFCGMTMKSVGSVAGVMVNEVRRQFRETKGLLSGKGKPDYGRCVRIATAGAQKEMVLPALTAVLLPVVVGIMFGVPGTMGFLSGGITTGFVMACMLNNAGGAWDNAKKYIEKGNYGGKGSFAHKAGVIGDTVGDPFKDTSGPSLNILIKLMSMVALVFSGAVLVQYPKILLFIRSFLNR